MTHLHTQMIQIWSIGILEYEGEWKHRYEWKNAEVRATGVQPPVTSKGDPGRQLVSWDSVVDRVSVWRHPLPRLWVPPHFPTHQCSTAALPKPPALGVAQLRPAGQGRGTHPRRPHPHGHLLRQGRPPGGGRGRARPRRCCLMTCMVFSWHGFLTTNDDGWGQSICFPVLIGGSQMQAHFGRGPAHFKEWPTLGLPPQCQGQALQAIQV